MKYLYRLYQLVICLPILLLASMITSLVTVIGCMVGNGHFWGYYPGKCWAWLWIRLLLLPVSVDGREHLVPRQSYVFVANHQGAFDIFLNLRLLGSQFQVDDEERAAENTPCRRGLPIRPPYFCGQKWPI